MKPKIISVYLVFGIMMFCGISVFAASNYTAKETPKYTDKENALNLASILDKGMFGRYTISSAYVQNDNIHPVQQLLPFRVLYMPVIYR